MICVYVCVIVTLVLAQLIAFVNLTGSINVSPAALNGIFSQSTSQNCQLVLVQVREVTHNPYVIVNLLITQNLPLPPKSELLIRDL